MKWRYEESTKTIRSIPENYWIATMDSWDGAVNHAANPRLIAAAPDAHALALHILAFVDDAYFTGHPEWEEIVKEARAVNNKVNGQ